MQVAAGDRLVVGLVRWVRSGTHSRAGALLAKDLRVISTKNVLVVDESDGRRRALAASFRALGWSVWEASSPMEVVRRMADDEEPALDVISVSTMLHDTPGGALLSFARECFPSLVRVLVCDRHGTAELAKALALADVVLRVPWSMFDLAAVVQAALRPPEALVVQTTAAAKE